MLFRPFFSPAFLKIALSGALAFSGIQKVSAEDEGSGFSVGRLQFGKATNDKWLQVDLKRTNRSTVRQAVPVVRTAIASGSRPRFATNYPTTYATSYQPVAQPSYPSASTMVSNHKLLQAASIAVNNAHEHSTGSCWRYVKSALLKAEAINSYPKTGYAKQAASELVQEYGFVRTTILNPFSAPIGSVLVYGGSGAGHIEIRTRYGFVSDFVSAKPSSRPLIGVFVKL